MTTVAKTRTRGRRCPLPEPPRFTSWEEEAAWLESKEGRRYMAEAPPLEAIRFVPAEPGLVPITIRVPADLPNRLRRLAESRSMAYQTLARQWLLERCAKEEAKAHRKPSKRKPRAPKAQQVDQAAG